MNKIYPANNDAFFSTSTKKEVAKSFGNISDSWDQPGNYTNIFSERLKTLDVKNMSIIIMYEINEAFGTTIWK